MRRVLQACDTSGRCWTIRLCDICVRIVAFETPAPAPAPAGPPAHKQAPEDAPTGRSIADTAWLDARRPFWPHHSRTRRRTVPARRRGRHGRPKPLCGRGDAAGERSGVLPDASGRRGGRTRSFLKSGLVVWMVTAARPARALVFGPAMRIEFKPSQDKSNRAESRLNHPKPRNRRKKIPFS